MKKYPVRLIWGVGMLVFFTHIASAQWVPIDSGLARVGGIGTVYYQVTSLAVIGSTIFAGTGFSGPEAFYNGVFLSTNNGTSWTSANSGLTDSNVMSLAVSGSNIFAGTFGGGVFRSTNNGESWMPVNSGLPDSTWVFSLAVIGSTIFAGTEGGGIFLSTNNGASWTPVNSGLPDSTWVQCLAVSGSNIFAGTYDRGAFLSTNNGTGWTAADSGLPANTIGVTSLAVSGSNIFAGTQSGSVFLSTNNGAGWTEVDSGFPANTDVLSLAVVSGSIIFAGTLGGVFLSTNTGANWTAVDSGFVNTVEFGVRYLAVIGSDIFAGTNRGLWRRPLSEMIAAINYKPQSELQQLSAFNVIRSNHNVAIGFSLLHSEPVTISIYNSSGREITSLVNKNLESGLHSFYWNTRSIASGYYTVRMQAGSNTFAKGVPITR